MNDLLEATENFVSGIEVGECYSELGHALALLNKWVAQEHERRKQAARDAEKE